MNDPKKPVRERIADYLAAGLQNTWKQLFEGDVVAEGEEAQARAVMAEIRDAVAAVGRQTPNYDPAFGDDRPCACGHEYHRHFDSYGRMEPVGCKYCPCDSFKDPATGAPAPEGPYRKPSQEDD